MKPFGQINCYQKFKEKTKKISKNTIFVHCFNTWVRDPEFSTKCLSDSSIIVIQQFRPDIHHHPVNEEENYNYVL